MNKFFSIFTRFPLISSFAGAFLLLVLILWIVFSWLNSYTRHSEFVSVPDFISLKTSQLERFVDDKDVRYTIVDSLWDPEKPKGVVLNQDPVKGTQVKAGRMVYLYTTCVLPPKIAMPKLEDLSQRQAQYVCEGYGLKAVFKEVDDPHRGAVVEQLYKGKRIEPGTLIEKGETIVLKIGKGDESVSDIAIPSLVGLTYRQARGKLMDMNLDWVVIADAGVKDTLNAIVYEQNPTPGSGRKIIPGSTIDIRVTFDKEKLSSDSAANKNP